MTSAKSKEKESDILEQWDEKNPKQTHWGQFSSFVKFSLRWLHQPKTSEFHCPFS